MAGDKSYVARWSYLPATWIAPEEPVRTDLWRLLSGSAPRPLLSREGGVYSTGVPFEPCEADVKVKEALPMTGAGARSELAKWSVVMPGLSLGNLPSFVICAVRAAVDLAEAPDSLAAARAKGRQFAEREYDSADNLTLLDAQAYAGRNAVVINDERERGKL